MQFAAILSCAIIVHAWSIDRTVILELVYGLKDLSTLLPLAIALVKMTSIRFTIDIRVNVTGSIFIDHMKYNYCDEDC